MASIALRAALGCALLGALVPPSCSLVNAPGEEPEASGGESPSGGHTATGGTHAGGGGSAATGGGGTTATGGGGAAGTGGEGGQAGSGGCGPTNTLANCGQCGHPCQPLNATGASCTTGTCDYQSCNTGYHDCDSDRTNGCERTGNTLTDCGGCNVPCAPANAVGPTCASGTCSFAGCVAPYLSCDNVASNGCETDTSSSAAHCGGCNAPCNSPATCQGGQCLGPTSCIRIGWKYGADDWTCPAGYRMPTTAEWAMVEPCLLAEDYARFDDYHDVGVSVGGCNCKWNANWCGQPSIETIRGGRMCGDYDQLQVCVA